MTVRRSLSIGWLLAACSACSSADVSPGPPDVAASAPVFRGTSVAVERRSMHAFLAEYHRALLLLSETREVARAELSDDSGGYSRANLYRQADSTLLLVDAQDSYRIDPSSRSVRREATRRAAQADRGVFLGAFDVDSARVWRFIAQGERGELPVEFHGGDR